MIARAAIAALWLGVITPASAQVVEDDGTIWRDGIHVCNGFAPMVGVNAPANVFLCQQTGVDPAPVVDNGTQAGFVYRGASHAVHVCPPGLAVSGLTAGGNGLVCSPARLSGRPVVDLWTQIPAPNSPEIPLRICPPGHVMVGLHLNDNALICQPSS
jgi:hypothetical protein